MMEQDDGRVPAAPGSREPSREGVSAASGFDPSRDETTLLIADKDRPLAFLELSDVALGRFARGYLIQIERAVRKSAGRRKLPLSMAMSMHGAIALYRMAIEANAGHLELSHEGVEFGGRGQGDWTLTVNRHPNRVPLDVSRLVIAARKVAYEGADDDALRELDEAAEAFAEKVLWDDAPRDSDRSGEAIETALAGSTVGESAGRNGIAKDQP